jgi:TM2 domain-containing membrane protein YozV
MREDVHKMVKDKPAKGVEACKDTSKERRTSCKDVCEVCPARTTKICCKPNLGLTLILSIIGFGADRFYVGQVGLGIALLFAYISVVGLIIAIPVQIISQVMLIYSILTDKTTVPLYGCTEFETPCIFDKIVAIIYFLFIIIVFVACIVVASTQVA